VARTTGRCKAPTPTPLARALHRRSDAAWQSKAKRAADRWRADVERITGRRDAELPYEGEVIGAVQRSARDSATRDIVVCAAGTLPAELHKLWRTATAGGYHVEYGYSCMGYEIAGGLGVKMAKPESEVIVIVGDGSYLMLNSEIATSVMLGRKLIIVVLDNHGYGCINRLQQACGGEPFNNLFADCVRGPEGAPQIDFAAHAALSALTENVKTIPDLEAAAARACRSLLCHLHRDRPCADDRGERVVVGSAGPAVSSTSGCAGACSVRRGTHPGGGREVKYPGRHIRRHSPTLVPRSGNQNFFARPPRFPRPRPGLGERGRRPITSPRARPGGFASASDRHRPLSWAATTCRRSAARRPLDVALTKAGVGYQGFEGNRVSRESRRFARCCRGWVEPCQGYSVGLCPGR
jgi:hypothetical protein